MFFLCLRGFPLGTLASGFRLIGDSKLPIGVTVSACGCLTLYVSPVMSHTVTCLHPLSAGIGWEGNGKWVSIRQCNLVKLKLMSLIGFYTLNKCCSDCNLVSLFHQWVFLS